MVEVTEFLFAVRGDVKGACAMDGATTADIMMGCGRSKRSLRGGGSGYNESCKEQAGTGNYGSKNVVNVNGFNSERDARLNEVQDFKW